MAIGYSKTKEHPSVVCVTAGCGATNAVTPCLIAYQDSVPLFFISGAVPHKDNVRFLKHTTRTHSGSDCDIIDAVKNMTKFSYELWNPAELQTVLDKCLWHMTEGRPGPVWLSVPLDIQSAQVPPQTIGWTPEVTTREMNEFPIEKWSASKRPVILVGGGVRNAKAVKDLEDFVERNKVPVVCSFFGTDLVPEYNVGRVGVIGDRTGNFTMQNSDFLLVLGCRLSKSIIGYRPDWFARDATIFEVNLEKGRDLESFFKMNLPLKNTEEWLETTRKWKSMWFRELPNPERQDCPYTVLHEFFDVKPQGQNIVVSSGSIYCVAWHMCIVKQGDRFISSGHGDMGYELPCALGVALETRAPTWAIVGDGSFQFNVQELQTLKTLNLPVKILYFDNGGYGAIQITQDSYFKRRFGVEVPCPDIRKVCMAWDIPYFTSVHDAISHNGPCLVHIKCIVQQRYPRLSNQMRQDGTFDNRPMEDMWPFLDRGVFEENMKIAPVS
jgi:acetolactate synthase-1/2/3 large subunit